MLLKRSSFADIKPNTEKWIERRIQKSTSKIELFITTTNNQRPFTVIAKNSIPGMVPGSSSENRKLKRDKSKILQRQVTKSLR